MNCAEAEIRSIYTRWTRLEEDKREVSAQLKDLFAEAKGSGFDTKCLRAAFRQVAKLEEDRAAVEEHEAVVDLYVSALTRDAREEAA